MSNNTGIVNDTIVDNIVSDVTFALGNRTDLATKSKRWIRDAYFELGNTIDFETLEGETDLLMVEGTENYAYPQEARALKSVSILVTNQIQPVPLIKKNIAYIRRYPQNVEGIPSIWAPLNRQIIVRMIPNDAYPLHLAFWTFPVVTYVGDTEEVDGASPLLIPDDWVEVVKYGAIMRGWTDLKDYASAQAIHQMLFGDPKDPDQPGMIQKKLTMNQAENAITDYAINPKVRRYIS